MEKCIAWYGNAFLEASIGVVLRQLISDKVAIEVDPVRNSKPSKDVVKNIDLLILWCERFWKRIFEVRKACPEYVLKLHFTVHFSVESYRELCALLSTIRTLVEEHSRRANLPSEMQQQRPWQSVSAFVFLRFLVPGILHPHLFGLCSGIFISDSRDAL